MAPQLLIEQIFATHFQPLMTLILCGLALMGAISILFKARRQEFAIRALTVIILLSCILPLIGLSILRIEFETHYLLVAVPGLFVLISLGAEFGWQKSASFLARSIPAIHLPATTIFSLQVLVALVFSLALGTHSLWQIYTQVWTNHGWPAAQLTETVSQIDDMAGAENYNFAVLAKNNSRDSYEFFFLRQSLATPKNDQNNQGKLITSELAPTLFVVCEELPCDPRGKPDWNVARFEAAHPDQVKYEVVRSELPVIVQGRIN